LFAIQLITMRLLMSVVRMMLLMIQQNRWASNLAVGNVGCEADTLQRDLIDWLRLKLVALNSW